MGERFCCCNLFIIVCCVLAKIFHHFPNVDAVLAGTGLVDDGYVVQSDVLLEMFT